MAVNFVDDSDFVVYLRAFTSYHCCGACVYGTAPMM